MRIGINLLGLRPNISGGIEFYIRNLLVSLFKVDTFNYYFIFTNKENNNTFKFRQNNVRKILLKIKPDPQIKRIFWEQFVLPFHLKKYKLDLLHSPTYTWPLALRITGVVSIMDMLYKIDPGSISRMKLAFWRIFVPWSAWRCKKVLTISEHSKKDIVRFLKIPEEKVTVTPLALDHELKSEKQPDDQTISDTCGKYGIRRPYILNVGGIGKHKNPFALIKALKTLKNQRSTKDLGLVITGNDYGVRKDIESMLSALSLGDSVRLPGYISRTDLPSLYAGALAYVSPSYFEGFGLTLLEAMAFGTPVVSSDKASLPEVAGDAAIYIDPDHPEQIVDAVTRIKEDPDLRAELTKRGVQRIEHFSWEQTARLTLEAYREAVGKG